jgi:hypothetical protein
VTALHLLLSASSEDVESVTHGTAAADNSVSVSTSSSSAQACSSLPAASDDPTQIFDTLLSLGLPAILLETATLLLVGADLEEVDAHVGDVAVADAAGSPTPISTETAPGNGTGASDKENDAVSSAASGRWANCSLTTTDRFIRSSSRPSAAAMAAATFALGSPLRAPPSSSTDNLRQDCSGCMDSEIASAYYRIIGEAEAALRSDFIDEFGAKFGVKIVNQLRANAPDSIHNIKRDRSTMKLDRPDHREHDSLQFLRGKVARECIELLRLLAIYPGNRKASTSSASTIASTGSASILPNRHYPPFPVTLAALSVGSGAGAFGVAAVPGILNRQVGFLLESLLTAPLVYVMMTDVSLFTRILSCKTEVRRPLAIWSREMRETLLSILAAENQRTYRVFDDAQLRSTGRSTEKPTSPSSSLSSPGNATESGTAGGSTGATQIDSNPKLKPQYAQIAGECVVDNVYIRMLLQDVHRDDVGARYA